MRPHEPPGACCPSPGHVRVLDDLRSRQLAVYLRGEDKVASPNKIEKHVTELRLSVNGQCLEVDGCAGVVEPRSSASPRMVLAGSPSLPAKQLERHGQLRGVLPKVVPQLQLTNSTFPHCSNDTWPTARPPSCIGALSRGSPSAAGTPSPPLFSIKMTRLGLNLPVGALDTAYFHKRDGCCPDG